MRPFQFVRVEDADTAVRSFQKSRATIGDPAQPQYLAGGTTLLDLMKLDVLRPDTVIDIGAVQSAYGSIAVEPDSLKLGSMVKMSDAADHPEVRNNYPIIAQALQLAASQQIRNMASLGGNVLQRTRCSYFRDTSYTQCNKRVPGSGCAALAGVNRSHAVLGVSDSCIATYPGDFAQALMALDATVEIEGARGRRTIGFSDLHLKPGNSPQIESTLALGELITGFVVPNAAMARRSLYLKIRDRQSYEFALASAGVALELDHGKVKQARIALGGLATMPWRAREAENVLLGKPLDEALAREAADRAFDGAISRKHNAFKIELGKRTIVRALQQVAALEIQ